MLECNAFASQKRTGVQKRDIICHVDCMSPILQRGDTDVTINLLTGAAGPEIGGAKSISHSEEAVNDDLRPFK